MSLFLFTIIYAGMYLIPYSMPIVYGVSSELLIVISCYCCFIKTPWYKSISKAGWFSVTSWVSINLIFFTWFSEPCNFSWLMFLFETTIFVSMFIYSQSRSYDLKSDNYNNEDVFIIFKKPRTFLDFLFCCVFRPVSSVSVVASGKWYGYTRGVPFRRMSHIFNDGNVYVKVNLTREFVNNNLREIIGDEWNYDNNCCHAIQRLFPEHKFSLADSLPAHLINTIIKDLR